MSVISKEQLIREALEKYSENQISNAFHCNVSVLNKDGIRGELHLPLTNRGKKTKTEKIKSNIRSFLFNTPADEYNKKHDWDTSSKNIQSIDITLQYKIDGIGIDIKKNGKDCSNTISFQDGNIITLIGENGSGKSSILEAVLEKGLSLDNGIFISYSSGLNESFSGILNPYLEKNKKLTISGLDEENEIGLNGFYFNKSWVGLLIFLAYSIKGSGLVRKFFQNEKNEYLIKDGEPFIQFNIQVQKYYIEKLKQAVGEHKSLETTDFHNMLDKLLNNLSLGTLWTHKNGKKSWNISEKREYDFEKSKKLTSMILKSEDVKDIFGNDAKMILYYLGMLTNNTYFLDIKDVQLYFSDFITLNSLSDGEFQVLMVYALIDLFDTDDTVFLFDEIDSHLHYRNINKLWNVLKSQIKGKVITTTHIPDSIMNNSVKSIKLVENGKINGDKTIAGILDRLDSLSDKKIYEMRILRKVENFVLIDDEVDWLIFQKLIKKKLGEDASEKIKNITCIKKTSSRNTTHEILGKGKLQFVEEFFKVNKGKENEVKNIFLICDRDSTPLNEIKDDLQVNINREYSKYKACQGVKTHLLCWKRLEIENYLLSKPLLQKNNCFPHYDYSKLGSFDGLEDIATLDCKQITHPLYKDGGFNEEKLDKIISKIPSEEISGDIEKMYNFIIGKI